MKTNTNYGFNFCRSLFLLVVIIALPFLAAAQEKTKPDKAQAKYDAEVAEARKAIEAGNARWVEGWRKGNAAMVASIFAPDGMQLLSKGRFMTGREAIMKSQQAAMDTNELGVEAKVETVCVWLVDGDAYETGKWSYKYIDKGKTATETVSGRYVTVWKKQKDGSWKLYIDMNVPLDN